MILFKLNFNVISLFQENLDKVRKPDIILSVSVLVQSAVIQSVLCLIKALVHTSISLMILSPLHRPYLISQHSLSTSLRQECTPVFAGYVGLVEPCSP
jgi:hypothetical protein